MKKLLVLLALGTLSPAVAHTEVTSVTLVASPASQRSVLLRFSEPVELRLSTFRVMAIPAGKTPADAAKMALALRADAPELVNVPLTARNVAARLTLPLRSGLKSGAYVIAWKTLSDDGHPVTGQRVFRVQ